ncbi:hypothetical protein K491DRAFT_676460 [Lophiostoma macrostomum CBS 122681]|uniref:Uncharacterized protein n=1 Tax=Lophiostoma macrostomum CBS 122681 TaxID=1314788 RepID=A0A6A6TFE0_9PLEO|nr:hypothetical protein K491DRAFT_676460 [Lophiostoma macrostomum CBS 122681]
MPFDISRILSTHKRSSTVQTKIPSSSSTPSPIFESYKPRTSHPEPLRSNAAQPVSPQSYKPTPPPRNEPTKPKPTVAPITVLPCGCKRNHVLISKLSPITECSSHYPGPTSAFSSSSSSPSSTPQPSTSRSSTPSLQRSIDMHDFPISHPHSPEPSTTALPSATELDFQYYIPHLSTSTHDVYTDCSWIAFDTLGHSADDLDACMAALVFPDWSSENMNIPLIREDQYKYYPDHEHEHGHEHESGESAPDEDMDLESFRRLVDEVIGGRGAQRKTGGAGRRRLKKKRAREEFWLERKVGGLVGAFGRWRWRGRYGKGKKEDVKVKFGISLGQGERRLATGFTPFQMGTTHMVRPSCSHNTFVNPETDIGLHNDQQDFISAQGLYN